MDKATFISAIKNTTEGIAKANAVRNAAIVAAFASALHGEGGKTAFAKWAVEECGAAGVSLAKATVFNALRIAEGRESFPALERVSDTVALRATEDAGRLAEGERPRFTEAVAAKGLDAARADFGIAKTAAKSGGEREAGAAESTAKDAGGKIGTADAAKAIRAILARVVPADLADARDFAESVVASATAWVAGLDFGTAKPATRRKAKTA